MSAEVDIAKAAADSSPFSMRELFPTLWMIAISATGGAVNFYHKVKSGQVRAFNLTELVGELVTSSFAGIVTFWICKSFSVNEWLTAAGVAIAGHMGTRAIFLLEKHIEKRADREGN